jgi:hypothetical protein
MESRPTACTPSAATGAASHSYPMAPVASANAHRGRHLACRKATRNPMVPVASANAHRGRHLACRKATRQAMGAPAARSTLPGKRPIAAASLEEQQTQRDGLNRFSRVRDLEARPSHEISNGTSTPPAREVDRQASSSGAPACLSRTLPALLAMGVMHPWVWSRCLRMGATAHMIQINFGDEFHCVFLCLPSMESAFL